MLFMVFPFLQVLRRDVQETLRITGDHLNVSGERQGVQPSLL